MVLSQRWDPHAQVDPTTLRDLVNNVVQIVLLLWFPIEECEFYHSCLFKIVRFVEGEGNFY